jgi:hypothetical protein
VLFCPLTNVRQIIVTHSYITKEVPGRIRHSNFFFKELDISSFIFVLFLETSNTTDPPHGFDNNFVIAYSNNATNQFEVNNFVGRFEHEKTGRFLEVYSNQPGVQFYTGVNYLLQLKLKYSVFYI